MNRLDINEERFHICACGLPVVGVRHATAQGRHHIVTVREDGADCCALRRTYGSRTLAELGARTWLQERRVAVEHLTPVAPGVALVSRIVMRVEGARAQHVATVHSHFEYGDGSRVDPGLWPALRSLLAELNASDVHLPLLDEAIVEAADELDAALATGSEAPWCSQERDQRDSEVAHA